MNSADRTRHGRTLAVLAVAFQVGALIGLIPEFPDIASSLSTLKYSGLGDPSTLGPGLIEFLPALAVSLSLGAIGHGLLVAALVPCRYRAPWFFWFLVVYGGLLLPVFPVGTGFGVFFLVYCLKRRREFVSFVP